MVRADLCGQLVGPKLEKPMSRGRPFTVRRHVGTFGETKMGEFDPVPWEVSEAAQ